MGGREASPHTEKSIQEYREFTMTGPEGTRGPQACPKRWPCLQEAAAGGHGLSKHVKAGWACAPDSSRESGLRAWPGEDGEIMKVLGL